MIGYVQVYTGNGKGKTTAALGLAFRAAGHGFRTYIAQFLKGQPSGELEAAKKLAPLIRIEQFGREGFITVKDGPDDEDISRAGAGLARALEAMLSGEYGIVVLDEVNTGRPFQDLAGAGRARFHRPETRDGGARADRKVRPGLLRRRGPTWSRK